MSFAGWFQELPSGMTYRLWEQGGHERQPGEVALYTLEPDTARRLEVAQRLADALTEATRVMVAHGSSWKVFLRADEVAAIRADLAEWESIK